MLDLFSKRASFRSSTPIMFDLKSGHEVPLLPLSLHYLFALVELGKSRNFGSRWLTQSTVLLNVIIPKTVFLSQRTELDYAQRMKDIL